MTTSTPTDDAPTTSTPTTPSSWTPPTARELFDAGSVVVRREFLSAPPPRAPARDDAEEGRPRGTFGGFTKRYKRENRDRRDGGAREVRLCHDFLRGACAFGEEKCKFSHDVDAYVKSKAPDLPGTCTFVNREGGCPYGVKCRYLGSHDGNAKEAEGETVGAGTAENRRREMNFFDRDVMKRLRKKTYDFLARIPSCEMCWGRRRRMVAVMTPAATTGESAAKRAKKDDECTDTGAFTKTRPCEKKQIDFKDKLYLAPLTTVGNLPFRRLCKTLGADVTCGEMALATNLLQGQQGEWALLRRHTSEDIFGVQICGGYPDSVTRCCQLLEENIDVDFIDINMGCPIDMICQKGYGSMMLEKPKKMAHVIRAASAVLNKCSLTFKTRIAYNEKARVAHTISPKVAEWGAAAMTLHGRTRAQRYRSLADWEYIKLTKEVSSVPLIGNGDVYNQKDYYTHLEEHAVDTCMLARARSSSRGYSRRSKRGAIGTSRRASDSTFSNRSHRTDWNTGEVIPWVSNRRANTCSNGCPSPIATRRSVSSTAPLAMCP